MLHGPHIDVVVLRIDPEQEARQEQGFLPRPGGDEGTPHPVGGVSVDIKFWGRNSEKNELNINFELK